MALKNNALIIPACGFDSVLPDVAVYVSNRYVKSVLGPKTSIEDSVTAYDVSGGFFGLISAIMPFVGDVPREKLVKSATDYALRHRELCDSLIYRVLHCPPACSKGAPEPFREIRVQTPI